LTFSRVFKEVEDMPGSYYASIRQVVASDPPHATPTCVVAIS
jgi:hypothetical protein